MLDKLKAACGSTHIWIFAINIITTAVIIGVAWGSLHAEVTALEHAIEQYGVLQQAWNLEEHRTDDTHRERINQIENQIFQLISHLPR